MPKFHFILTEAEALALIHLGSALDDHLKRSSPLERATIALDEQMASQKSPWDRCDKCNGSGWVEDA